MNDNSAAALNAIAEYDRLHPPETWYDRRQREQAAEQRAQEQGERKEREQANQQQNTNVAYWKQLDDRTYECINLWNQRNLESHLNAWSMRQFENVWRDVFGRILAQERKSVRDQVAEATKKMLARIDELETTFWTQWQRGEKRHTEAMEQIGQRMAALEGALAETRHAIGDVKRELTEDVTKRIGDLDSAYWGRRETDEQRHAEQTKEINDRLTAFERNVGDI